MTYFSDGVEELVAALHDQGIGCNYRPVENRRWHSKSVDLGPDGPTNVVEQVWDDPEPTGYDRDGWKHDGDHLKVARAMRAGVPGIIHDDY